MRSRNYGFPTCALNFQQNFDRRPEISDRVLKILILPSVFEWEFLAPNFHFWTKFSDMKILRQFCNCPKFLFPSRLDATDWLRCSLFKFHRACTLTAWYVFLRSFSRCSTSRTSNGRSTGTQSCTSKTTWASLRRPSGRLSCLTPAARRPSTSEGASKDAFSKTLNSMSSRSTHK